MKMTIEQRLQQQEDFIEIARLKAVYCRAADCGWGQRVKPDAETIASIFVDDGVWDAGSFGRADGRDAIFEYFNANQHPFGLHYISNQIITIDQNKATGEWDLFCPTIIGDNQALWIGGTYNDEFIRTPEGWKFKKIKVTIAFTSNNALGFNVVVNTD
jgi:hypothetical protein